MRSANIFERLVIVLSRAAQGRQAVELGTLLVLTFLATAVSPIRIGRHFRLQSN